MGTEVSAKFESREINEFLEGVSDRLKGAKGGESRYTGLLSAIIFQDVAAHFQNEEGSQGPWAKWSKSYREQMDKKGRSGSKILQWTGNLRQSFKPTNVYSSEGGPIWFNDAQTRSGFPYAYAHDTGGPKLPQRDFMWLSETGLEKVGEQTLQFLLDEGI